MPSKISSRSGANLGLGGEPNICAGQPTYSKRCAVWCLYWHQYVGAFAKLCWSFDVQDNILSTVAHGTFSKLPGSLQPRRAALCMTPWSKEGLLPVNGISCHWMASLVTAAQRPRVSWTWLIMSHEQSRKLKAREKDINSVGKVPWLTTQLHRIGVGQIWEVSLKGK